MVEKPLRARWRTDITVLITDSLRPVPGCLHRRATHIALCHHLFSWPSRGPSRGCSRRNIHTSCSRCGLAPGNRLRISRHRSAAGAVPVLRRIADALAHRDGAIPGRVQRFQHVVREVVHRLEVDVVLDVEEGVAVRAGRRVQSFVPYIFAGLDGATVIVQVALGVEIKVDDVVS